MAYLWVFQKVVFEMKLAIPKCLITRPSGEEISVQCNGNQILFAFSSIDKGSEFCKTIRQQGQADDWYPYNMTSPGSDLRPFLLSSTPSEKWFVAVDAKGLADESYQVAKLTAIIEAAERELDEIEFACLVPGR